MPRSDSSRGAGALPPLTQLVEFDFSPVLADITRIDRMWENIADSSRRFLDNLKEIRGVVREIELGTGAGTGAGYGASIGSQLQAGINQRAEETRIAGSRTRGDTSVALGANDPTSLFRTVSTLGFPALAAVGLTLGHFRKLDEVLEALGGITLGGTDLTLGHAARGYVSGRVGLEVAKFEYESALARGEDPGLFTLGQGFLKGFGATEAGLSLADRYLLGSSFSKSIDRSLPAQGLNALLSSVSGLDVSVGEFSDALGRKIKEIGGEFGQGAAESFTDWLTTYLRDLPTVLAEGIIGGKSKSDIAAEIITFPGRDTRRQLADQIRGLEQRPPRINLYDFPGGRNRLDGQSRRFRRLLRGATAQLESDVFPSVVADYERSRIDSGLPQRYWEAYDLDYGNVGESERYEATVSPQVSEESRRQVDNTARGIVRKAGQTAREAVRRAPTGTEAAAVGREGAERARIESEAIDFRGLATDATRVYARFRPRAIGRLRGQGFRLGVAANRAGVETAQETILQGTDFLGARIDELDSVWDRLNERAATAEELFKGLDRASATFAEQATTGLLNVARGMESLGGLAKSLLQTLAAMVLQITIISPFQQTLQNIFSVGAGNVLPALTNTVVDPRGSGGIRTNPSGGWIPPGGSNVTINNRYEGVSRSQAVELAAVGRTQAVEDVRRAQGQITSDQYNGRL